MKKSLAVIFTVIGGILANAVICSAGVYLFAVNPIVYIIAEAFMMFMWSLALIAVTGRVSDKTAVPRKALYICAQAPLLAVHAVNFIKELVTYSKPGNGIFGGWKYINLGLGLGVAICMLATSVLTTAFAFVTAAVARRKGLD